MGTRRSKGLVSLDLGNAEEVENRLGQSTGEEVCRAVLGKSDKLGKHEEESKIEFDNRESTKRKIRVVDD